MQKATGDSFYGTLVHPGDGCFGGDIIFKWQNQIYELIKMSARVLT